MADHLTQDATVELMRVLDELAYELYQFLARNNVTLPNNRFPELLKGLKRLNTEHVREFLKDCGYASPDATPEQIVEQLLRLPVLKPYKTYLGIQTNEEGYVTSYSRIDTFMEERALPEDLLRGYYKIVDGKPVLDEERRRVLWEV
jgi:hypothetical protein